MALFPCAVGLHRYVGPQQSAYLGLVNGSQSARVKQRLCPKHFRDLTTSLDDRLSLIAIGEMTQVDEDAPPKGCGHYEPASMRSTAFATVYPTGSEPHQYARDLCSACADNFAEAFKIDRT